jgi:hypothetical protein
MDDADPEALERCVQGATYPVWWSVSNWSTQMGSSMRHAIYRAAARAYAKRHLAEHGRLPEGPHRVVLRVSTRKEEPADLHVWYGGPWVPRFEAEITYPAQASSAPA